MTRRTIKQVEKEILALKNEIEAKKKSLETLEAERIGFMRRQNFTFPDGTKVPFGKITLFRVFYTRKGLGYEDDRDEFSEFMIKTDDDTRLYRFLSKESQKAAGVPIEIIKAYGRTYERQSGVGTSHEFVKKFKKMIDIDGGSGCSFVNM